MEEHRMILKDVFGESSDSEDDEQLKQQIQSEDPNGDGQSQLILEKSPSWERVSEINGLWICRDLLSPQQQSSLLSSIEDEGWFTEASHNQAMRFGNLPAWAIELAKLIREVVHYIDHDSEFADMTTCCDDKDASFFPSNLFWREPLFDQLIVNVYSQGICAHVDLMRFEDGIAIVSLESSCVMHFTAFESEDGIIGKQSGSDSGLAKIPVHLTPGSLVLMWGEARYLWKHEINRQPGCQTWEGKDIEQKRRTSITLRKLCPNE
ncbi:uncharacterized protein LOC130770123 isoform X2 [Actinidia eriantha]|uniref:uncharacterized protein LOC130770123 isoform X2 n=1 Tax=Actinidia eriantha TaxID=165200 RepID=UPI002589972C|nr:uncharacterized protein LOC130770123 isoform X2 [Actinidia eriantha]